MIALGVYQTHCYTNAESMPTAAWECTVTWHPWPAIHRYYSLHSGEQEGCWVRPLLGHIPIALVAVGGVPQLQNKSVFLLHWLGHKTTGLCQMGWFSAALCVTPKASLYTQQRSVEFPELMKHWSWSWLVWQTWHCLAAMNCLTDFTLYDDKKLTW